MSILRRSEDGQSHYRLIFIHFRCFEEKEKGGYSGCSEEFSCKKKALMKFAAHEIC